MKKFKYSLHNETQNLEIAFFEDGGQGVYGTPPRNGNLNTTNMFMK